MSSQSSRRGRNRLMVNTVSFALDQGGIARVGRLMAKALCESDLSYSLSALDDREIDPELGPILGAFGGNRLRFVSNVCLGAATHSHFIFNSMGLARAGPPLALVRRPYLTWIHGVEAWGHVRRDWLHAAESAAAIFAVTAYSRQRASRDNTGFSRAKVCWLATEDDEPPLHGAAFDGPPTVLIVSRVAADEGYKGHDALIECWPAVRAAVPSARLVIAGSGSGLQKLRDTILASPCRDAIEVLGFVPEADLPTQWRRAHVFAMPSRGEGFGLVYIEAMRYGLPVIASVHDAGQEVNVDGETGYNVSLDRPGELAERLIELLRDTDKAQRMGQAGRARWREHFRFSAFRRRFLPMLDEFLGTGDVREARPIQSAAQA